ncbi:MAG: (2Fe-2S)-binding protein [Burkholderiales bacterium]|nr:(2Fe-2S)-binding protein [Burkholderiales bacterium]
MASRDLRIQAGVPARPKRRSVTLTVDGDVTRACEGESVAAALWAERICGSAHLSQPDPAYRVLFCAMGTCQ